MSDPTGVVFPEGRTADAARRALGRAVVADALRPVDPVGAAGGRARDQLAREYRTHFRRLVEAGLLSPEAAVAIARRRPRLAVRADVLLHRGR